MIVALVCHPLPPHNRIGGYDPFQHTCALMSLRIIDSEFGAGAGDRLGRIEKMYHRVGSALSQQSLYYICLIVRESWGEMLCQNNLLDLFTMSRETHFHVFIPRSWYSLQPTGTVFSCIFYVWCAFLGTLPRQRHLQGGTSQRQPFGARVCGEPHTGDPVSWWKGVGDQESESASVHATSHSFSCTPLWNILNLDKEEGWTN